MNDENHQPQGHDALDQAIESLRSAAVPAGPSDRLTESTLEAISNRLAGINLPARPTGRRSMLRYLGYGSLAGAVTVLAGLVLSGFGPSQAMAFDKVIELVQKADAVRFRVQIAMGPGTPQTSDVHVSGNKLRVEDAAGPGITWIVDWDEKAALIVAEQSKMFQTVDMSGGGVTPVIASGMNIRDELLALRQQQATREDPEEIDGAVAEKFVIPGGKAFHMQGDWTVWVDRKSGLPVKVALVAQQQGHAVTRVYDHFDWNPPIDATTFSIEPPANFTERSIINLVPPLPPRKRS